MLTVKARSSTKDHTIALTKNRKIPSNFSDQNFIITKNSCSKNTKKINIYVFFKDKLFEISKTCSSKSLYLMIFQCDITQRNQIIRRGRWALKVNVGLMMESRRRRRLESPHCGGPAIHCTHTL